MIIRVFRAILDWERKKKLSSTYSIAYILFGFIAPSLVVFTLAFYLEDEMKQIHPDFFISLLFGSWVISAIVLRYFDR